MSHIPVKKMRFTIAKTFLFTLPFEREYLTENMPMQINLLYMYFPRYYYLRLRSDSFICIILSHIVILKRFGTFQIQFLQSDTGIVCRNFIFLGLF